MELTSVPLGEDLLSCLGEHLLRGPGQRALGAAGDGGATGDGGGGAPEWTAARERGTTGDGGGGTAEWGGLMATRRGGAEMVRGGDGNFIFYERDRRNEVGCRVQWDRRLRLSVFVYSMLQSR